MLAIVAALAISWTAVLAWPGTPPCWVVLMLFIVLRVGGPGPLIGLDIARTFNPLRNQGSVNGIVNVGGFLASFVMMFHVGVVVDALDRSRVSSGIESDVFAWESFRLAFLVHFAVVGFGFVGLLLARRRSRALMEAEGGMTVTPLWMAVARSWRRRW